MPANDKAVRRGRRIMARRGASSQNYAGQSPRPERMNSGIELANVKMRGREHVRRSGSSRPLGRPSIRRRRSSERRITGDVAASHRRRSRNPGRTDEAATVGCRRSCSPSSCRPSASARRRRQQSDGPDGGPARVAADTFASKVVATGAPAIAGRGGDLGKLTPASTTDLPRTAIRRREGEEAARRETLISACRAEDATTSRHADRPRGADVKNWSSSRCSREPAHRPQLRRRQARPAKNRYDPRRDRHDGQLLPSSCAALAAAKLDGVADVAGALDGGLAEGHLLAAACSAPTTASGKAFASARHDLRHRQGSWAHASVRSMPASDAVQSSSADDRGASAFAAQGEQIGGLRRRRRRSLIVRR